MTITHKCSVCGTLKDVLENKTTETIVCEGCGAILVLGVLSEQVWKEMWEKIRPVLPIDANKHLLFDVPNVTALDPFLLKEKPKPDIDQIHMTAKVEGDDLVIRLPLDLLVHSQLHREESMTITDTQKMAAYMAEYILDWGGDAERGSTAFEDFLDAFFMDALESAETWIAGWWEGDENESDE